MKLLIVGAGGREHALTRALVLDNPQHRLFVAPGNPGTAALATNLAIRADDTAALAAAAAHHDIDLVVVGPEAPLAHGLADRLRAEGRAVFGPGAAGAKIEASKAFAKDIMHAAGIPTASSATFTDLAEALGFVERHTEPLVVKASGLAAGKGVVVCDTRADAATAVRAMLGEKVFGEAGSEVVIEEFLDGEELSVLAVTNGRDVQLLPTAQDHKRLLEGDRGPNTGGMGAYAPVSLATPQLLDRVRREVLCPALDEMRRRGIDYRGVLYAGLMLHPDGTPNVVEFNCRLGDPETEVVLPLLESGVTALFDAAARGKDLPAPQVRSGAAVTTVLAAAGYPGTPATGAKITIPDDLGDGVTVYHAGTARRADGALVVAGGRVLAVTAVAQRFDNARRLSRDAAARVAFDGKQMRGDIGWREAARAG